MNNEVLFFISHMHLTKHTNLAISATPNFTTINFEDIIFKGLYKMHSRYYIKHCGVWILKLKPYVWYFDTLHIGPLCTFWQATEGNTTTFGCIFSLSSKYKDTELVKTFNWRRYNFFWGGGILCCFLSNLPLEQLVL